MRLLIGLTLEFQEPRKPSGGIIVESATEPKALASSEAILEKLALVLDSGHVKREGMGAMGAEEPGGGRLGCCCCCVCDGGSN